MRRVPSQERKNIQIYLTQLGFSCKLSLSFARIASWQAHRRKGDGAECLRKVKAHTTAADIGVKISVVDRIGTDLADAIAEDTRSRFPNDPQALGRFAKTKRAFTAWAKWIGILGTLEVEDDCERPPEEHHVWEAGSTYDQGTCPRPTTTPNFGGAKPAANPQ